MNDDTDTSDTRSVGRPLKFETVEALQEQIDDYFNVTPKTEWTWTGLAMHLDTSRETLREYKERKEYVDPLRRALLKVENGYEIDAKREGKAGSIFALKNFGWKDKTEVDQTVTATVKAGNTDPLLAAEYAEFIKQRTLPPTTD